METEKKNRPRSKAYPAIDLNEALKKTDKINENFGLSGAYNRETMATGMGYGSLSGTASRTIAALVQYGLLDRTKDQYRLSSLAKRYLTPVEDDDIEQATREAAIKPSLFQDIYNKFGGQIIPKQFVNRLINEFGIQQNAAPDVERIFKTTMEVAGILKSNGILETIAPSSSPNNDSVDVSSVNVPSHRQPVNSRGQAPLATGYQEIALNSGVKVHFPTELSLRLAMGDFADALKNLDAVATPKTDALTSEPEKGIEV